MIDKVDVLVRKIEPGLDIGKKIKQIFTQRMERSRHAAG